jgi:hypothetical protein
MGQRMNIEVEIAAVTQDWITVEGPTGHTARIRGNWDFDLIVVKAEDFRFGEAINAYKHGQRFKLVPVDSPTTHSETLDNSADQDSPGYNPSD